MDTLVTDVIELQYFVYRWSNYPDTRCYNRYARSYIKKNYDYILGSKFSLISYDAYIQRGINNLTILNAA